MKLEYTDSKRKKRELLSVYIIMIRLLSKNYINILFENDFGIVLIIGVLLYFNGKKKYNTDLETINPPMTKKDRKALMFYRKTKCNWGGDYSDEKWMAQ